MNKVATLLLCLCFITVLFPQPGYIHPDEFFQSTEIVAGDVLEVHHTRAWEFNSSRPIRSIVFPYLLSAPLLHLLRWMNSTTVTGFKISAVKVVMATRLPIAFLNLFGYLATGRMASHFAVDKSLSTILWCSSYVFWSYYTRTFSNSVESFLLALVFLITLIPAPAVQNVDKTQKKEDNSRDNRRTEGSEAKSQSSNLNKQSTSFAEGENSMQESIMPSVKHHSSLKGKSFLIGALISAGFFNRPTFLVFSAMPVAYWYFSVQDSRTFAQKVALLSSMILYALTGTLFIFFLFIALDTLYYKADFLEIFLEAFYHFQNNPFSIDNLGYIYGTLLSSLVVTPWNFLKYNVDSRNLAQHGIHPRYSHFLINLPLLIGPLFFPFIVVCISSLYLNAKRCVRGETCFRGLWLVFMALVPILTLSIFPHQEPRFLIPLLPVFIVISIRIVSAMAHGRRAFLALWVIFNIFLHLIYGYLHQAAVIPVLSIYQQRLSASLSRSSKLTNGVDHMIFYKTYPPPIHLLLMHESRSDVEIHDLAGSDFKILMKLIGGLEREWQKRKEKSRIHIFLPSTVSAKLLDRLAESESNVGSSSICPHLSTESPPRFLDFLWKRKKFDALLTDLCLHIVQVTPKD